MLSPIEYSSIYILIYIIVIYLLYTYYLYPYLMTETTMWLVTNIQKPEEK